MRAAVCKKLSENPIGFSDKLKAAPFGAAFSVRSIVSLVFVLAGSLALFATLYAGTLVVLLLSQVLKDACLCTATLESFQSIVQRFVFLDMDFRHLFHSLR